MWGHNPACPPCSAVHASASSGASTRPAIATAAHCQPPSGSSRDNRVRMACRTGTRMPPAGATALIATASVVETDLVDEHAGLAPVAHHLGQRQGIDLQRAEAGDHRIE